MLVLTANLADAADHAAIPIDGPALDDVPGPVIDQSGLPAPAQWPVVRYDRSLRMLAVVGKGSLAPWQRVARRMRSTIEFRYVGQAGDAIYHVNDKWIEPKNNPTADELNAYVAKVAAESLAPKNGQPPADVIFSGMVSDEGLLASVKAGAVLVTCGNVYPGEKACFAPEWPARPTPRNSWMSGGAQRVYGEPALAGLPVQWLAGHTWIPIAEPTDGSAALATGETGAVFTRKVGKGAIIFVPTGLISRFYAAITKFGRVYDHDEIWLRLWDQLLYETVRGADALPAFADLQPGAKEAPLGQDYVLPGKLVNRKAPARLTVSVHVTTPRGTVVYSKEEIIDLAANTEKTYEVRVPVAAEWPAGMYPVCLTIGDPAAKKQLHQAMEFIPVTGQLQLTLVSAKKGYRLGEDAKFTLTASGAAPWSGTLCFGVYDFRGRLLAVDSQPINLETTDPRQFTFSCRMADHGVRADAFWAEVVARKDGGNGAAQDWARAEVKFYKYEPWSMRDEYQWSTWAGIACPAPSLAPRGMRLMAHAGMNSLGYPGRNELHYAAERWGWRYYNEGIGMNTFSPVIEYENDAEIEAMLLKQAERSFDAPDLNSAAFVLASVGEEAGYKNGWGHTYYWDTPVAEDKACRAFQWYLKTRYGELARLNATWRTNYQSWDELKLTKEFSGRAPRLEADGWAHPKESPLGQGVEAVSLAPYSDTTQFYAWYYDRIIAAAQRILREHITPVAVTMASAPSSWIFESRECDVRLAGPSCWNESQMHSLMDGPEPGFGLIWGHFDWSVKTDNMFWGFLLSRCGHNNYWVDVPLMFNGDMTHTRSSFAMRQWTHRLAGHERIILDSRPAPSDVGLLDANGLGTDRNRLNMVSSLKVALNQGGFGLPNDASKDLAACKIVFAIGHQSVSKDEADRLHAYVNGGGVLVLTPRFASQDEFGAPQPASPGQGLAEKWGLKTTAGPQPQNPNQTQPVPLDGVAESFKGVSMATFSAFREKVEQQGWSVLAQFEDGTPAVLSRTLGKGRLYYVNAIYQSHWYIQWVTPTGAERQGFYRLIEWLCEQAGAQRTLKLEGDLAQMLHVAVKEFTDASGSIRYAIVRTSGEVPWVAGRLSWLGPQTAGYDVLDGEQVGRTVPLNLKPGAGRLLAFVEKPVKRIRVEAAPSRITAGQPLQVAVDILADDGKPVRGSFPVDLRVAGANRTEIAGLHRSVSVRSGEKIAVNTALSDPAGKWTITVTDGISGVSGSDTLSVSAPRNLATAPGFVPWGWPSEIDEPALMSTEQFVAHLRDLAALYRTDHAAEGWLAKQRLGYYYEYFPNTRHAILQPLLELDWPRYAAAIRTAVQGGAEFIFTGEDIGIHPGSGLSVYPHHDAKQFAALTTALDGATWSLATPDGGTIAASLGKGRVILCRESIDAAGHDSPSIARWQQRWLASLNTDGAARIPTPKLAKLLSWWVGREAITRDPLAVTWLEGNRREVKLSLGPDKPLGEVFAFVIPPTGDVQEVTAEIAATGPGEIRIDVGCDNTIDPDWKAAVIAAAKPRLFRDDNAWRIIPVRVTAGEKTEVEVKVEKIAVK